MGVKSQIKVYENISNLPIYAWLIFVIAVNP